MKILPSDGTYATFCDLTTGYRMVSILMQAVECGIIEAVGQNGCSLTEVLATGGMKEQEGARFLELLVRLGVLEQYDQHLYLSQFSRRYLLGESGLNQLKVLEFEKLLMDKWKGLGAVLRNGQGGRSEDLAPEELQQRRRLFQEAMHGAALVRAQELWDALPVPFAAGTLIDIGTGDGTYLKTFLERHAGWHAVACDLEDTLALAAFAADAPVSLQPCNLLDPQESAAFVRRHAGSASILLLSNLIHCYGPQEVEAMFLRLGETVQDDGLLVIHDFFTDGNDFGALYDAHMLVNTYNGRAYSIEETSRMVRSAGFSHVEILELPSYSHAIVATRHPRVDSRTDRIAVLRRKALALGFFEANGIDPALIRIEPWVKAKCSYGCSCYGRKWSCPPHSMGTGEFRELLACYSKAIVVAGQPPLEAFQRGLLELEKEAFLQGSKKALVFSGGPCCWCESCDERACRFPEKRRPSLESCGCDVFALAEACGITVRPIRNNDDFVQYIGLLLVE
ncbi:DUF2284 domain-containing protein [Geobacter sp. SVR]|uniref:DUF2284 domain-containing protein n=1 Tax=Geobacter sp. SVR TaxID=2495594 RepID=UPI00143EFBC1|nr:DUF2284 domain-containing protein [Geobacter sp. SVR]BCS55317.1 hypothetical protein GSVR_36250 [Geobacter sp. SVR]GCF87242.1 hypothetical protein GSbR_38420 [Geobacter sp. SVR]